MNLSDYKFLKVNGINMKKLELDGIEIWRWAYTNQVPYSINADGTIYNNGLGYKNGYRVRSGGAEGTQTISCCTGFIRVNSGDVVRITGANYNWTKVSEAINASDVSFTNLGQIVGNSTGYGIFSSGGAYYSYSKQSIVEESTGVWLWVVPPAESGVRYIRVTAPTDDGSTLTVTINEEII